MSDILGRLVDRALDAGDGLRPRAAARFEAPEAAAPALRAVEWRDNEPAGDVEQEQTPRRVHRQGIDRSVELSPPSDARGRQAPGVHPPAPPQAPTTAPDHPAVSRTSRTSPQASPDRGGVEEPDVDLPVHPRPRRRPQTFPVRAASVEPPSVDAALAASPSESAARSTVRPRLASTSPTTAPPAAVSTQFEPTAVAAPAVVTRRADVGVESDPTDDRVSIDATHIVDAAMPHREARAAPRFEPQADMETWPGPGVGGESRPIVRVSIGRIEVRAATTPAAPVRPAASPRTGAPSLEEYLRARNGTTR